MKITIMGAGWVGLISGACFAELGNVVTCVDYNTNKISSLNKGVLPIYEQGLREIFDRNRKEKRLFFSVDSQKPIQEAEIVINAVGTPPYKNGRCDLSGVKAAAREIGRRINGYKVIINKSTVPVGTAEFVEKIIKSISKNKYEFDVVSSPEFLSEGRAVNDFFNPARIIVGTNSPRARKILEKLYFPIIRTGRSIMFTAPRAAELIKYASNCFLATKISFINEIAGYCEKIGVDVQDVERGMGMDNRIGSRFLHAGIGFGGSCFPKDVDALIEHARDDGYNFKIIKAARDVNRNQKLIAVKKLKNVYPNLKNKRIAVWGVSFKPKTDDIRMAPSIDIIKEILQNKAKVRVFDPIALNNFRKIFSPRTIFYADNLYRVLKNSDALLILTEWDEFRNPDFEKMKKLMKEPIIIDGRNIYDPLEIKEWGFKYFGVGRI